MKDWREKLTKEELIHLMESGVHDLDGLKRNFEAQATMRIVSPSLEPCHECKAIARKLNMLERKSNGERH